LDVGLFDDGFAPGIRGRERLSSVVDEHGFHDVLGMRIGLPLDFLQLERRHADVLKPADGAAGLRTSDWSMSPTTMDRAPSDLAKASNASRRERRA
jgi:hypothetical protein